MAFHTRVGKAQIEIFRIQDLRHCIATYISREGVDTVAEMRIVHQVSDRRHRRSNTVSVADLMTAPFQINAKLLPPNNAVPCTAFS